MLEKHNHREHLLENLNNNADVVKTKTGFAKLPLHFATPPLTNEISLKLDRYRRANKTRNPNRGYEVTALSR